MPVVRRPSRCTPSLVLLALASLATLACSSGQEYRRGTAAPVRPSSPTFRPSQDAPHTTGQPGHTEGPAVRRSPNTRYVEPRRDGAPQLMAADGDDARAVELMLSEPVPATPEGLAPSAWAKCWEDFKDMARGAPRFRRLSLAEAKCLRNRVLNHCGARFVEAADRGDSDFLKRYPPKPMQAPAGQSPRGARTVGVYSEHDFEEAMAGRRAYRACGREHEFWTDRVSDLMRDFERHGDDVLGWRNP